MFSAFRGFSAPVKLEMNETLEDLALLVGHDRDPVNRWDAAQRMASKILLSLVAERRPESWTIPDLFVDACRAALDERATAPALAARILRLPTEQYLAEQMTCVDVEGIDAAQETLPDGEGFVVLAEVLEVDGRTNEFVLIEIEARGFFVRALAFVAQGEVEGAVGLFKAAKREVKVVEVEVDVACG